MSCFTRNFTLVSNVLNKVALHCSAFGIKRWVILLFSFPFKERSSTAITLFKIFDTNLKTILVKQDINHLKETWFLSEDDPLCRNQKLKWTLSITLRWVHNYLINNCHLVIKHSINYIWQKTPRCYDQRKS